MSRVPNVVIVDAHPAEQALLRYCLSRRGLSSTAVSPRAGLDVICAAAPDLVLLDAGHDLSGVQLSRAIRERVPGASVVLISDAEARPPSLEAASADSLLSRPLTPPAIEKAVKPYLDRAAHEPSRRSVLVIDDDPDVLRVIEKVLVKAGCEVTCVADSRQLLEKPPQRPYDLVLIDVVMPEVDGLEVCYVLRKQWGEDLRICMITAAHDPDSVRKAELYGADGFLTKPVRPQELLALVGRARLPTDPHAESDPAASREAPTPARRPATQPRAPHVLVVDDDRDILDYCRAVFGKAGAVVDAIQDPSGLREKLPPGGAYDLVLLDIFMPSVDGIELLRRFSSDVKNVSSRFYIITAEEDAALRSLAHRSGADGYLTKPLEPRQLLDLLAA